MTVGKSLPRVDAYAKVTGQAKYTEDLVPVGHLTAMVLRSRIANGLVKEIRTAEASQVPGVHRVVTCFEVPDIMFPTAGHPWSTEASHQDVADRRLLNKRVLYVGDEIAAVIAEDEVACRKALERIQVDYEEYEPLLSPRAATVQGALPLHEEYPTNILKDTSYKFGDFDWENPGRGVRVFSGSYGTQAVQHSHIEKPCSFAYMEKDRITVVSSTQIPHIVRRVVGQALGIPWGRVRVVKPYIGGGFGNKQEVLYEPLNAYLTTVMGGRCVKLVISREETYEATRSRHSITFDFTAAVDGQGKLLARKARMISNQGAYASHGHAIVANCASGFRQLYQDRDCVECRAVTVYTNLPAAGAMRGYGIPQVDFAMECHMQDIAEEMGLDPLEFRLQNAMKLGFADPGLGITCHSTGLRQCVEKGRELIGWDRKYRAYQKQKGNLRQGVGMAIFSYKTGVYPISLETASCRLVLNQDGTCQLQMGATEIGQGADTVFTQMAAETIGLLDEDVQIVSFQDTDVTPFDTGAYASRQTYVSGKALVKTGRLFKEKILDFAAGMLERKPEELELCRSRIVDKVRGDELIPLSRVALEAFYSLEETKHITAEATNHCRENTYSFGACFTEVEVDLALGKVRATDILNIHDSGRLINPRLAQAQIHGGMSMGLGYGLSEQMLFDDKGRLLNGNFLDYKLPTSLDTPELQAYFVETYDSSGPFGNKALGEPPAIPQSAALRNAIKNATGVAINQLPLTPQKLTAAFNAAGLYGEKTKSQPAGGKE
ncbi:MAG: xanthine dehydrogenase subunit XdhA [Peptococcaceae bacterium]|nr:xanthine dehydrogenase subunit XdhA [Peptococcaceae bacterium]